jgi:hypothetical protein
MKKKTRIRFAALLANHRTIALVSGLNEAYSQTPGALKIDYCIETKGLSEKNLRRVLDSLPEKPATIYTNCSDTITRYLQKVVSEDCYLEPKNLEQSELEDALHEAIFSAPGV